MSDSRTPPNLALPRGVAAQEHAKHAIANLKLNIGIGVLAQLAAIDYQYAREQQANQDPQGVLAIRSEEIAHVAAAYAEDFLAAMGVIKLQKQAGPREIA